MKTIRRWTYYKKKTKPWKWSISLNRSVVVRTNRLLDKSTDDAFIHRSPPPRERLAAWSKIIKGRKENRPLMTCNHDHAISVRRLKNPL